MNSNNQAEKIVCVFYTGRKLLPVPWSGDCTAARQTDRHNDLQHITVHYIP